MQSVHIALPFRSRSSYNITSKKNATSMDDRSDETVAG